MVINGSKNEDFELLIKKISSKIEIFYSKYIPINLNNFVKKTFWLLLALEIQKIFLHYWRKMDAMLYEKFFSRSLPI